MVQQRPTMFIFYPRASRSIAGGGSYSTRMAVRSPLTSTIPTAASTVKWRQAASTVEVHLPGADYIRSVRPWWGEPPNPRVLVLIWILIEVSPSSTCYPNLDLQPSRAMVPMLDSRISRCWDLAGVYSCIWIACRSRAVARVYGEGVHTVGATIACEPEVVPAPRKKGGDMSNSSASRRCTP
jgi:hypothetical protein